MRLNCHYSLNNYSVLQSTTPVLLQHYSVLQSTTPVLLQRYSSTTLYYKLLLQYYSVLQSTTPVLQSTTPVLQSTTPVLQRTTLYYKVRLQYYKVLLQYYNVLLCTTKYDSSTTLYYKVLLQYYCVLQSTTPVLQRTTPVLLRTTKYYSSTTLYYKVLQSTTPVLQRTTLYYSSTTTCYSVLQSTTPVLLCTTKHYSCTTPELLRTTKYYSTTTKYYKVLLPYYKVLLQYYSVLLQYYCVLQSTTHYSSTTCYSSTTPYYKVHSVLLKYYSVLQSATPVLLCTTKYYKVLLCTTPVLLQYYKVLLQYCSLLQSTTPVPLCTTKYYFGTDLTRHLQCAKQQASPSNLTKYCACHAKWIAWLIRITYETSFTMRGATGITSQPHQILRLPRKRSVMIDPSLVWNVIYNARSERNHPATSPNTAPATQKECHDSSISRMKRQLQCAKQQASPCNLTKYCACGMSWSILLSYETSFTMRGATGITLQPHQILRLPRKMNRMIDPHHIWNVIYNARSNRHHPATSPNTAPATQKECHDSSISRMKHQLQCAKQQASPCNLTKYCACHAKGMSWSILLSYETSFTMRGATGITLQPHQILRLPRKIALPNLTEIYWKQLKGHFQCPTDPRAFRPWSENDPTLKTQNWTRRAAKGTFRARQEQILLKITTFPAPAIIPNFTTCCPCHKKWHMNFTKCCTCHKKWHMNFTKCCNCHKK